MLVFGAVAEDQVRPAELLQPFAASASACRCICAPELPRQLLLVRAARDGHGAEPHLRRILAWRGGQTANALHCHRVAGPPAPLLRSEL